MDLQTIIAELQGRFGDDLSIAKIEKHLKGRDLGGLSLPDIIAKVKADGLLGDLDGDGVKESLVDEIKGKAGQIFGGMFGKK